MFFLYLVKSDDVYATVHVYTGRVTSTRKNGHPVLQLIDFWRIFLLYIFCRQQVAEHCHLKHKKIKFYRFFFFTVWEMEGFSCNLLQLKIETDFCLKLCIAVKTKHFRLRGLFFRVSMFWFFRFSRKSLQSSPIFNLFPTSS